MHHLQAESVVSVVISHFMRALMRIEREKKELTSRAASKAAGWSWSTWDELEQGEIPIEPDHWISAVEVLELSSKAVVYRLNAYIEKHPAIWLERQDDGVITVSESPITSDRAIHHGNIYNFDLGALRPKLYDELSTYALDPKEIPARAKELGFYHANPLKLPQQNREDIIEGQASEKSRREQAALLVQNLPLDKFGLLERILDKFEKFSAEELAYAYQHFSLSVHKR